MWHIFSRKYNAFYFLHCVQSSTFMELVDSLIESDYMMVSPVLFGHDLPAKFGEKLSQTSIQCYDQTCDQNVIAPSYTLSLPAPQPASITVFRIEYEPARFLPNPAPPPRLHYSTFWRSVAKRIYRMRSDEIKLAARSLSPKLSSFK